MADKTENKPGFVARAKAAVKNFFGKCAKFFRRHQERAEEGGVAVQRGR